VYAPLAQNPTGGSEVLLVRGADPAALVPAVRGAIARVDPELAVFGVEPLTDTVATSQGRRRFMTQLLAVFAGVALLLAAVGIHAMLTYDISERRREIGIRLALGAVPSRVCRMVIGRASRLAAAGLILGAVASLGLTRLIRALLFEVSPGDWMTLVAVSAVLGLVAIGASIQPARRAVREDVAVALRDE
jgi:putative ABC transport system permease protein